MGSMADEKILGYNDVVLRRSDLGILSGPRYLNDRIIEFYYSYLPSIYPCEDILLIPPGIAFWILHCPDTESLKDFLDPLNLSTKKLVFLPVNDNVNVMKAEGGNHWSLLVFVRETNVFVHHDSLEGLNARPAKQLYNNIVGYMKMFINGGTSLKYVECSRTPQQENGYDCGLYVLGITKAICSWYESSRSGSKDEEDGFWFDAVEEQVTPSVVAEMRYDILGLIKRLMAASD